MKLITFLLTLQDIHVGIGAVVIPESLLQKGLIVLACFTFIMTISYLKTSTHNNPPKRSSINAHTELPISLELMSHIHAEQFLPRRSFKETFLAFPWKEFEMVVAKNLTSQRIQFTKLFIDELTHFIELEPFVPKNANCHPPPLPSQTDVNCSLYPNAFDGVKRNDSVKIGAIFQFGFDVDVLEIHLNELYGVVDVFFIIESTHAHYGSIKKPLVWENVQRQERFLKFPVVHLIIDDAVSFQPSDDMWSMETTQERLRWKKFLEWNDKTEYFGDDDVIGFGDVDEIPNRNKLNMFKYCRMKGDSVDFGIWFPFGHINQTFKSDFPIKGHPFTLGDPTYYTLASTAKALTVKKPNEYPNRRRGKSGNYVLGGMHMSHYGYLPFQLVKYCTATESNMQTLKDVEKLSNYLKVGDVRAMEMDFAATPKYFANRIVKVDPSNSEMMEICILPWFYDCNRDRYPVWEGGHDTRLDFERAEM